MSADTNLTTPDESFAAQAPAPMSGPLEKMARIMPWILSVFFHMGVVMILAFATLLIPPAAKTASADDQAPVAGPIKDIVGPPGTLVTGPQFTETPDAVANIDITRLAPSEKIAGPKTGDRPAILAIGGTPTGRGDKGDFRLAGPRIKGKRIGFYEAGGNAYHAVYVIDRSGSMMDQLDHVKREMLESISHMSPEQDFHVIFFADDKPRESSAGMLVPAIPENTTPVADFINDMTAEGRTDPVPAIKRAFEVLSQADPDKHGKIIYLLTDGVFPDNQKVLDTIHRLDPKKEVAICTILFNDSSPKAIEVLQQIAMETRGQFRKISTSD